MSYAPERWPQVVSATPGELHWLLRTCREPVRSSQAVFFGEFAVKYTVVIEESDEGFAVSVPGLPGCHSQGETEAEALDNITHAIREYLDGVEELATSAGTKQVAVEV